MNRNRWLYSFALGLTILALLIIFWTKALPARAAFGNRGVPVRCAPGISNHVISANAAEFFDCMAADGTLFTGGQFVPAGYYLLVTDIIVAPTQAGLFSLGLFDVDGANNRTYGIDLMGANTGELRDPYNAHFTTPYFVLPAGHRLEGVNSGVPVNVYISGLLVTNVIYLPVIGS